MRLHEQADGKTVILPSKFICTWIRVPIFVSDCPKNRLNRLTVGAKQWGAVIPCHIL